MGLILTALKDIRIAKYLLFLLKTKLGISKIEYDIFITSFPKCGRTWLRAMIGRIICQKYNIDERWALRTEALTTIAGLKRVIFRHDIFSEKYNGTVSYNTDYSGRDVILITRGIKDTIVSWYFQNKHRQDKKYNGEIDDFIKSKLGIELLIQFYNDWSQNKEKLHSINVISYEELHSNTQKVVNEVMRLVGLQCTKEEIEEAIQYCSFNKMQKREIEGENTNKRIQAVDVSNKETFKSRKGKVGNYGESLSKKEIEYIDQFVEDHLIDQNFFGKNL